MGGMSSVTTTATTTDCFVRAGHKLLLNQAEPLTFHDTHSEHIRLYNGGRMAKRVESFCKGICFSARPISVGELVSIRCSDVSLYYIIL